VDLTPPLYSPKQVSLLSKIEISPQRLGGRREMTFLFGGERPPNKRPPSMSKHALFAAHSDETQL